MLPSLQVIANQFPPDHTESPVSATQTGNPTTGPARKQACKACRQRKKKCDGNFPCTACKKWSVLCEYAGTSERHRTVVPAVSSAFHTSINLASPTWPIAQDSRNNTASTNDAGPRLYSPILPPFQLRSPGALPNPFPWGNHDAAFDLDTGEAYAAQQRLSIPPPGVIDSLSLPSLNWSGTSRQIKLPSQSDVLGLTDSFFERAHLLLPSIQRVKYIEEVKQNFVDDPQDPLPWIICAVSAITNPASCFQHQGEEWFQKAKRLCDEGLKSNTQPLSKLQAAAWITFFLFIQADFSECSFFLAKAYRFACHHRVNRIDADPSPDKRKVVPQNAIEREEFRGATWALYYLDRQLSFLAGTPLVIEDRFYCVDFPADGVLQYDTCQWPTYPRNFSTELRIPPPPSPDNPEPPGYTPIPICWIYKSSVLLGRVLDFCSTPHKPTVPSKQREDDFNELRNTISRFWLSLPHSITDFLNVSPQDADRAAWLCIMLHVCSILLQLADSGVASEEDSHIDQATDGNFESAPSAARSSGAFSFVKSVLRLVNEVTQNLPTTNALKNPFLGVAYILCCRLLVLRRLESRQESHCSDIDLLLLLLDRMGESWSPLARRYRHIVDDYLSKDRETLVAEMEAESGGLVDLWANS